MTKTRSDITPSARGRELEEAVSLKALDRNWQERNRVQEPTVGPRRDNSDKTQTPVQGQLVHGWADATLDKDFFVHSKTDCRVVGAWRALTPYIESQEGKQKSSYS